MTDSAPYAGHDRDCGAADTAAIKQIRNTPVTIVQLVEILQVGGGPEALPDRFPSLPPKDVRDTL